MKPPKGALPLDVQKESKCPLEAVWPFLIKINPSRLILINKIGAEL